jgi:hypothetical protein
MPERVTPEERLISLAIEKARKAKELLSDPNGLDFTEDEKLEMEKVKRPKAEKVTTKIPNQEKEGYGLAGQEIKKKFDIKEEIMFVSKYVADVADIIEEVATNFERYEPTIIPTLYNKQTYLQNAIDQIEKMRDRYVAHQRYEEKNKRR